MSAAGAPRWRPEKRGDEFPDPVVDVYRCSAGDEELATCHDDQRLSHAEICAWEECDASAQNAHERNHGPAGFVDDVPSFTEDAQLTPAVTMTNWLWGASAATVSALLGVYQLGDPSIWIDEAFTAEMTGRSYRSLMDELQWGHFTLEKAWSDVAGVSEVAMRVPSVIGGVVSVVLLFGLARMLVPDRVAAVSSFLLAVNPFVVLWSQQARGYTILLALVIGATWLLLRALEQNSALAWAGYGVVLTLLVYWHPFSAFLLLPVHVLAGGLSRNARTTWLLVGLCSLPWLVDVARPGDSGLPTDWIPFPGAADVGRALVELSGATGVGLLLVVTGAWLVAKHRRLLVAWAALPFALALSASIIEPVFVTRYLIVSCPALAILAAVPLVELRGRLRVAAIAATVAGTLVGLTLWYSPNGSDNWAGENWREATAMVMREGGGARIVPGWAEIAFTYHGGRVADTGWVIEWRAAGREFDSSLRERGRFGERLRVLHGQPRRHDVQR